MIDFDVSYYPWFPARFAGSRRVRMLKTAEHHAIYRQLLDEQWRDGALPPDLADLEALMPFACDRNAIVYVLQTCFTEQDDGSWIEPVLEEIRDEVRAKIVQKSRAGRKAAITRWAKRDSEKRKGRSPMRTHSERNADAMRLDATETERETETETEKRVTAGSTREGEFPMFDDAVKISIDAYLDHIEGFATHLTDSEKRKAREHTVSFLRSLPEHEGGYYAAGREKSIHAFWGLVEA